MGLPPVISALLEPSCYPERPGLVEVLQTHVSYLLFTPEFVYKIKKPVDFGFLDFTTLDKRRHYCEEEVRLNRRLAPGVYLGTVAITEENGRPFMGGSGPAMEYAVKMRRLDDKGMLARMLREDRADEELIKRIGHKIAFFHSSAERDGCISLFGSIEAISRNAEENFQQTLPHIGKTVQPSVYEAVKAYTEGFLRDNARLFGRRVLGGFIRDCHGDLHSEHVFAEDGIEIIDCIEFNERFRYSDTIADAAFLSMDLDCHNRHCLSRVFDDEYLGASGDAEGGLLLDFYRCYRAFVRGKVEGFKAFEAEVDDAGRLEAYLAAVYHFHLAKLYATGGMRPMIIAVCGLPGAGKSSVSEEIARRTGFTHLSSDIVRKGLAGMRPGERRPEPFGEGIYSEESTERTYSELISKGVGEVRSGRSAILDATFSKRKHLQMAMDEARRLNVPIKVVECAASDEIIRRRLDQRRKKPDASDADWDIYSRQKAGFEEIKEHRFLFRAEYPAERSLRALFTAIFS